VIAEVSVDKVSIDVEAPIPGIVTCLVEEEAAVPQGAQIARID
jgi:pyruvate/2-oxoglutarate dehydrogenase complex dihydrolipoamide acyltransferase (E2) component